MARFSEVEQHLLKYVRNDRLITSLAQMREAMEDIWSRDAPRIIHDYTDHGELHVERVVGFAAQLLEASEELILSSKEMFLLLAGIYLHDIGMQCDLARYPEIKITSETLGAQFNIDFDAPRASEYSIEQQKAIRKNHHLISAAWIDYSYRNGATLPGGAIANENIEQFIEDIMDVCKYHSKLPISDCPRTFCYNPAERKQVVAALLRFSDELDIDSNRVEESTVELFSIDPHNSVYWWLHKLTNIAFISRNVIEIIIRLHPQDVERYYSLIYTSFIQEFKSKNQPVLRILMQHNLIVVISEDSNVVSDERTRPLPNQIARALEMIRDHHEPAATLTAEIQSWLKDMGYEVLKTKEVDSYTSEFSAILDRGIIRQKVLIRCTNAEISSDDIESLDAVLDRDTPQGWLISDLRVSPQAMRGAANSNGAIQVHTLTSFLHEVVWRTYFDFITAFISRERVDELYIDPACAKVETYPSLDTYIDEWLNISGKTHIALLGEFGSGKTWFCYHYVYRQLDRYLKQPLRERFPLLVSLHQFTRTATVQELINHALLETYKLSFVGSAFEVFQELNRKGKLLLVLDGFDEMTSRVDRQTVVDNYWEITKLINRESKVILTSRSEYFSWAEEAKNILGGQEDRRNDEDLVPQSFELLYLKPLSEEQIRSIISKRAELNNTVIADQILTNANLMQMAKKPIMIELLLAALEEVDQSKLINQTAIYTYAINKLLIRNIITGRTFTSMEDKIFFLTELAWEMVKENTQEIHYTLMPDRIQTYFRRINKDIDKPEIDIWNRDLRAQTLLHNIGSGYYEFAHRSIAAFCAAQRIINCLRELKFSFLDVYFNNMLEFSSHIIPFVADLLDHQILDSIYSYWSKHWNESANLNYDFSFTRYPIFLLTILLIHIANEKSALQPEHEVIQALSSYSKGIYEQREVLEIIIKWIIQRRLIIPGEMHEIIIKLKDNSNITSRNANIDNESEKINWQIKCIE